MSMWPGKAGQVFPEWKPAGNRQPRFLVRAGATCRVSPVGKLAWRTYRTRKDVGFERFERYDRVEKTYEFRHEGWLLVVHRSLVIHREDVC